MTPNKCFETVPIKRSDLASDEVREAADLAFTLWLANEFRGRSPEEALFAAVRQLRSTTAGLFVVPKRKSALCDHYPLSNVALN